MASKINQLQDRAAAVASLLEDLSKLEERTKEQDAEVAKLTAEATDLEERLAQETAIAARVAALRSKVAAAGQPAAVETEKPVAVSTRRVETMSKRDQVFASRDDAEISGHWLRGFVFGRQDSRLWCEKNLDMRALSSNDNSKGGVFAVPSFSQTIIDLTNDYAAIPSQANVIPMSGNSLYIPRNTGANTAYFVGDNSEVTTSDTATDNVLLSTKDCVAATRVPNSLIEDSVIDLASFVARKLGLALRKKIDDAGFAGDGTSTHGGIRGIQWLFENGSGSAGVSDSGESTLSAVTIDDVAELVGKLPTYARASAAFYMTPQVWSSVFLPLALGNGGATAMEVANGVAPKFMGYPVYFNDSMRTAPTGGQVIALFGDMKMSTHYGIRKDLVISASMDRYIEYRQAYIACTARFDITTSDIGDSTNAGPVVALTL
jgi:HK97 family phage major capsid protein